MKIIFIQINLDVHVYIRSKNIRCIIIFVQIISVLFPRTKIFLQRKMQTMVLPYSVLGLFAWNTTSDTLNQGGRVSLFDCALKIKAVYQEMGWSIGGNPIEIEVVGIVWRM